MNLLESDPRVATEEAGGKNGAVRQKTVREEGLRCEKAFPDDEEGHERDSEDNHANN
jgi:hypothetical protein